MRIAEDFALQQQGERAVLQEHQQALTVLLREFDRICKKLDIPYFLFAGTMLGAVKYQGFIPWDDDLDVAMMRQDYQRFLREAPQYLGERFYLQAEHSAHWTMFYSKLRLNGTACIEGYHPRDIQTHRGVYMDIFPLDRASDHQVIRRVQWLCSKVLIAKGLDGNGYETKSRKKKMVMAVSRLLPGGPFQWIVEGPKREAGYVHSFLGGSSRYERSVYPAQAFSSVVSMPFEGAQYPLPCGYHALLVQMYGDYSRTPSRQEQENKRHAILVDLKRPYTYYNEFAMNMTIDNPGHSIR